MSKETLIIVESPSKAKTIEKYLGSGYKVISSIGHVRDLPKSDKEAIDIEAGFVPHYINSPGKEKVIRDLQKAAKVSKEILLASDPDREGEAIAWHVSELIREHNPHLKRIVFHEITEGAVKEAILHPRTIDLNLKEAQEARRVLDRLFGYSLSGLIWRKLRYGLSAGRVQSPALRIIMEREREIRAFISEDYFVLTAHTKKDTLHIPFTCTEEPSTREEAERIKRVGEAHDWHILSIKETEAKRSPRPPFTTSTLQQAASTRLGFSPSRTMGTAQKLYEAGFISYMRTDSTTLSTTARGQILDFISKTYGKNYVQTRTYKTKSKSAQEAHEAIRPTQITKREAGLNAEQRALYELIWSRTVASQMSDARILRTKVLSNCMHSEETIPDFNVNGSRVIFDGWLKADPRARGEDTEVPKLSPGDKLTLNNIDIDARQTQPPNRYSEAGLIKELEKRGIGRPSTYASIMKTIIDRGYVNKDGRTLFPTDTGEVVCDFLETHFTDYISDTFTSEMEDQLDTIAEGTRSYKKTLTDFYGPFIQAVHAKEHIDKLTNLGAGPKEFPCPKCGADMIIKLGRLGKFLSCSTFPDCDGARLIDGKELSEGEALGTDPETGESIYVLDGRFGPYVQKGESPKKGDRKSPKPKRASIPSNRKPEEVTLEEALHYLILPRELGDHPDTKEPIIANIGKFGPYIGHAGDFRSLKGEDEPYTITYERALAILAEPKPGRKGEKIVAALGVDPKTKRMVNVYESKSGKYLRKGFKRLSLPEETSLEKFTLDEALTMLHGTKKTPAKKGDEVVRELGDHPKTKKPVCLFKSAKNDGFYLKKGIKRIPLPDNTDPESVTLDTALALLK